MSNLVKDDVYYLRHDAGHVAEGTSGTEDAQKRFGQAVCDLLDDVLKSGADKSALLQRALAGFDVMPFYRDALTGKPLPGDGNHAP